MELVGGLAIFVVMGGAAVATWVLSGGRARRKLRKAARVPIGAVQEGQVARVVGAVCRGETVEAPLSGRRCFCYDAVVEEKYNDLWRKVLRETGGLPFVIEDESGRAVVDPSEAELVLVSDQRWSSGPFTQASAEQEAFLVRHGTDSKGFFAHRKLRYREAVIELGEQVAVMGQGVREPDPDAKDAERGYRDALPTRLRMSGGKKSPLLISDEPDLAR